MVAGGDFLILSESEVVEPLHTGGSFLLRLTVEQGVVATAQSNKLASLETTSG